MFGYPVFETVRMALSYVNGTNFTTGGWKFAGLANFRALPSLQGWHLMLRNTLIFLVASIVPQFIIGGLLAVALTEKIALPAVGPLRRPAPLAVPPGGRGDRVPVDVRLTRGPVRLAV